MSAPPGRDSVTGRLDELFTQWPGEQALQFAEGVERRWWTWGDVAGLHRAVVDVCSARDVPADAAIAIVMAQRAVMAATELAVLALGRTALLVSPLQADRSLADELASLRAAVVVAHSTDWARTGVTESIAASGALGVSVDDGFDVDVRVEVNRVPAGPVVDAAVTVMTSGTTGPPKRMPVSWETFVQLGGGPDGRTPKSGKGALILSLPLVTLGGLLSMSRLVFMGRPMAMMARFDVHTWASLVKEHRPNVMGAPPAVVTMILDANISADNFEGVTAYLTSSAPVAPDVAKAFEDRYGIPVLLGYGATEFLNSVTGWTAALWSEFGASKLGSVGRPHPGVRLRVIDPDTGREMPTGGEGILEVDPPQRTTNLPAGWLRTTDLARIDADGFLWILGRADDVILRGGFKVHLGQVEASLLAHPAVIAACVVGVPDARLGQVPAAVVSVEGGAGTTAPTEAELIAWARERLPPYAVPVAIKFVDTIPRTATLKVHRAAVQELLRD
jgi:long-chain acyl-CoA synthetase